MNKGQIFFPLVFTKPFPSRIHNTLVRWSHYHAFFKYNAISSMVVVPYIWMSRSFFWWYFPALPPSLITGKMNKSLSHISITIHLLLSIITCTVYAGVLRTDEALMLSVFYFVSTQHCRGLRWLWSLHGDRLGDLPAGAGLLPPDVLWLGCTRHTYGPHLRDCIL